LGSGSHDRSGKSSEEGLEQSFNSLDAQREACEAYILSQRHEGWHVVSTRYDDGGFSGGNMERPGLKKLLDDIAAKRVDTVVVYKVDRLTRSLADFAKIVEQFNKQGISFVSVTHPTTRFRQSPQQKQGPTAPKHCCKSAPLRARLWLPRG
jgi:DNA invertase Pin-like site-specific DNA recombinase